MSVKTYKFSYGNTFKKVLSQIFMLMANMWVAIIIQIALLFIYSEINYMLENYAVNASIIYIIKWIEIVLCVVVTCSFFVQPLLPQKVELYERIIKVKRHTFSIRGFNDTILIDNIERIYIAENKDFYLLKLAPVGVVDWENLVVIEMQTGWLFYCFPIENSEGFIEEINKRRNELQKDKTDGNSVC